MTFLDKIDVGGQQYKVSNSIPMGTCATPAGTEVKECIFADNFQLSAGNLLSVTFTYANTYGDGSTTYPKLLIQGTQYPIKIPTGTYAGDGAWANGQAVTFMFDGTNFLMTTTPVTDVVASGNMSTVTSNAVNGAISDAIAALDAASVGGSGKYISEISEADGKINATATNLATSIASGGTTPPTSGAVYDNLITLLKTNNFRVFALGGDDTQLSLRITYSGNRQYAAIGFLIVSRYSTEFIHIELNDQAKFMMRKDNIIVKRSSLNVTISNTDNTITVSDGVNWNNWVILMFTASGEIFGDISFRAVT